MVTRGSTCQPSSSVPSGPKGQCQGREGGQLRPPSTPCIRHQGPVDGVANGLDILVTGGNTWAMQGVGTYKCSVAEPQPWGQ